MSADNESAIAMVVTEEVAQMFVDPQVPMIQRLEQVNL